MKRYILLSHSVNSRKAPTSAIRLAVPCEDVAGEALEK